MFFELNQVLRRITTIEADTFEEAQKQAKAMPYDIRYFTISGILYGPQAEDVSDEEWDALVTSEPDGFEREDQEDYESEMPFWLV